MHENRLESKLEQHDYALGPGKHPNVMPQGFDKAGILPGAFTVPVCENLGGEAISSLWEKNVSQLLTATLQTLQTVANPAQAKNFPCRCGNIDWENKQADRGKAQSKLFYELSGLYASDKFEDFCDDENDCSGSSSDEWEPFDIPEGWSERTPELKNAWKKCEGHKHNTQGKPDKDK